MEERRNWGWGLLALLLAYTLFAHQGLGLPKANAKPTWWHPTGFLNDWPIIGPASETWWVGTLMVLKHYLYCWRSTRLKVCGFAACASPTLRRVCPQDTFHTRACEAMMATRF